MLTFDSVKLRLEREQTLSFLEFNYMLLQAYDFLELHRRTGCRLQMGGSDQWGNIINGIDLTRRVEGAEVFGLTTPLITTSDGAKMGKTAAGAIWLNGDMLAPYDYWQFWRNTTDADVGRFLRLFTTLPLDEIARLSTLEGQEINEAKKVLANAATTMAHGAGAAAAAEATALETFEQGGAGADLPTLDLSPSEVASGISVVQLFVPTAAPSHQCSQRPRRRRPWRQTWSRWSGLPERPDRCPRRRAARDPPSASPCSPRWRRRTRA
jgi:tyrosyl-tRNA synthetase